jgi:hypothetical protein
MDDGDGCVRGLALGAGIRGGAVGGAAAVGVGMSARRLLLTLAGRGAGGPAIVRTNLLAEYRFAGNANDSGPNGYNASLGGGATLESFGVRMGADADFVSFPAGAQIADKLDHTLQIVFRVPSAAGDLVYVEGNGGTNEFVYINRGAGVGNIAVRYRRTTATSYDQTILVLAANPLNTWIMATLRRSGTALTVYTNDRALSGSAVLGAAALPTRNIIRLNNPSTIISTATPSCPDVAYMVSYTAALTDQQISDNYAAIKAYLALRGVSLP